jgi:hypothetical protein
MAFIENVGFYEKVGFVVYGNEYASMPKMFISAQAEKCAGERRLPRTKCCLCIGEMDKVALS